MSRINDGRPIYQKGSAKPKTRKGMRKVSAKKAAYKASKEGQAGSEYMAKVKRLPCCVCSAPPPSDAHHVIHDRYGTRKADDFSVIPLCKNCHQVGPLAIHNGKQSWRERNGPDHGFIEQTRKLVESMG